ncbi:hypothetical protein [Aquimarina mytili]|uniref:Uncharacterized protein n=1 Tax=Aquimarina mytili TaxID=874423 RepID=A0A936ZWL2_9FLAO|nr:hypothetical protein [Aquimarina mytili]MBL0683288.1 hypothetical protein [Aquimarina mytili]
MKKFIYLFALSAAVVFTSCSSDDDAGAPANTGSITFEGKQVTITSAVIEDFGADSTHHNSDFTLSGSDGTVTTEVYLELFSPTDGTGFKPGTFNFVSGATQPEAGTYYFSAAEVTVGSENTRFATGGQVVVAGSGNTYNVTANLTFENDVTLTLNYSGAFAAFPGL